MKKLFALLLVTLTLTCLFACKMGGDDPDDNGYPEGSIALTRDNLTDYFDIKVTTDVSDGYFTDYAGVHKQTKAVSYVALVPKADYAKVKGTVKYELNAGIITGYTADYNDYSIAVGEKELLLDTGILNASYSITVTSDLTYHANSSKNNITVTDVSGYLITGGRRELTEYDELNDDDRAGSDAVRAELEAALADYETGFADAVSFNYTPTGIYDFKSLYGSGRDQSNRVNYGKNGSAVDRANGAYVVGQFTYVLRDGTLYQQSKNSVGLVLEQISTVSLDELNAIGPYFDDLYDDGAVYVKRANTYGGYDYYAYTTLHAMENDTVKEYFTEHLENYGITTKWDKFVVKYTYGLDSDGGLYYDATVSYKDDRYHVEYVDVTVSLGYKVTDVNNATVTPYVAGKDAFALQDNLEDAMTLGTGAVTLKRGDTSFYYTTYSDAYEGYTSTVVENYIPLIIEESGVYTFIPSSQSIKIYGADGRQKYPHNNAYYEAGTYYVCHNSVLYGKNTVRMQVQSTYFDDFGSVTSPTPIEGGYSFLMESRGDRVALSFTPTESGIYSLGDYEDVAIDVYTATDLEVSLDTLYEGEHCASLTAGVEYILLLEYRGDGTDVSYSASVEYIGTPTDLSGITLTEQWQDAFLWWEGDEMLRVNIATVGDYYVEFELQSGQRIPGAYFYNLDGTSYEHYYFVDVEGSDEQLRLTSLTAGEYAVDLSLYKDCYFSGRVRLVAYAVGVTEEREARITSDGYITLTTSPLTTMFSTSTFTFEVIEEAKLLYTTDSDSFTIYDESGKRVSTTYYTTYTDEEFDNVEARYSDLLAPGSYTIVFEIGEYTTPGVKEATVRLLPSEK